MKTLLLGALLLTSMALHAGETIDLDLDPEVSTLESGKVFRVKGGRHIYNVNCNNCSKREIKKRAEASARSEAINLCKSVQANQIKISKITIEKFGGSTWINDEVVYQAEVTAKCIFNE